MNINDPAPPAPDAARSLSEREHLLAVMDAEDWDSIVKLLDQAAARHTEHARAATDFIRRLAGAKPAPGMCSTHEVRLIGDTHAKTAAEALHYAQQIRAWLNSTTDPGEIASPAHDR